VKRGAALARGGASTTNTLFLPDLSPV